MYKRYIKVFLLIIAVFIANLSFGQSDKDSLNVPIFTADSLASGNYKDIFSSFFQLAVNNLTGANKELKFTTNPYAIMLKNNPSLKRHNEYERYQIWRRFNLTLDAKLDSAYHFGGFSTGLTYALVNRRDYSMRRNFVALANESENDTLFSRLNRVLPLRLSLPGSLLLFDTAFRRKGWEASGINDTTKRAAIDKAFKKNEEKLIQLSLDSIVKDHLLLSDNTFPEADRLAKENKNTTLYADSITTILRNIADDARARADTAEIRKYYNAYQKAERAMNKSFYGMIDPLLNDTTLTFDKIDPQFRAWIFGNIANADISVIYLKRLVDADPQLIVAKKGQEGFNRLVDSFGTKGLWTVGVNDTSYSDGGLFKNVQLYSEYLKGFLPSSKLCNLELDLKGYVNFLDDSLHTGKNLQRQYWTFQPGVNLVFKAKKTGLSFFEFKLSGGITHVFKGYYTDDKNLDVTLNSTIRLRIFNEIWLPLQIKYDPQTGNVFGFLNITTNFTALSAMLKGSKK